MSWINEHKRVWRVVILVLLLVAMMGSWAFDRINVPAEYPCSAPNIRLEGDFCGMPMSGIRIFSWMIVGVIGMIVGPLTGAPGFADRGGAFLRESLFTLVMLMALLLLLLPFFNTLLSLVRRDRRRRQGLNVAAWGFAAGIGLLMGMSGYPKLFRVLWGVWLYVGLTVGALILEALTLAAEKRSGQE